MVAKILDENVSQILETAINTGDNYQLFDFFLSDDSSFSHLEPIFEKLGADIYNLIESLPEKEPQIFNILQILLDLIQAYGISEELSYTLLRPVLFLAVNEKCSVHTLKRAVTIFNSLLQSPRLIETIISDEYLEGAFQILGRKVPSIGDYECQALVFEALFRLTCDLNRRTWVNIWFSDPTARAMIMKVDPQQFESNCRKVLNYINRLEADRRVCSFIANSVTFGSLQLQKPDACDFWIDFNYDSQSISFFCSELVETKGHPDNSSLWETVFINASAVKSYDILEHEEKTKTLTILLNCPCHSLVTSSSITSPELESYVITFVFASIFDILQHVRKIFGNDKYAQQPELGKRKSSESSNYIQIKNNISDNQNVNQDAKRRKVSETSIGIKIAEDVAEAFSSQIFTQRKVSSATNVIPIPVAESENQDINQDVKRRKVSDTSFTVKIAEDVAENHNISQDIKRRKVSDTSFAIKITEDVAEAFSSEILSQRKVSSATNCVPIPVAENEVLSREILPERKVSNVCDPVPLTAVSESRANNITDVNITKEVYLSPSESDVPKNQKKIKRLYNLEKAPVFKGPFTKDTIKRTAEMDNIKMKCSAENGLISDTMGKHFSAVTADDISKSPVNASRNINTPYDQFPPSDEDFELNNHTQQFDSKKTTGSQKEQVHLSEQKQQPARRRTSKSIYSPPTENVAMPSSTSASRKHRKAAVVATKKNKKIFDDTSTVVFEKESDFHEPSHRKLDQGRKRKLLNSFLTDTETGSSDVSWLNKNKHVSLFETPRKSYSEWKKGNNQKRKLPIEIIPDEFSESKQHDSKKTKKKKPVPQNLSGDSGSKGRSFHWSDLDNFDLTVEKTTKRGSDSFLKALESDLANVSSAFRNISKEKPAHGPKISTPRPKLNYPIEEFVNDVTNAENIQTDESNAQNEPMSSPHYETLQPVAPAERIMRKKVKSKKVAKASKTKDTSGCARPTILKLTEDVTKPKKGSVPEEVVDIEQAENNLPDPDDEVEDSGIIAAEDEAEEMEGKEFLLRSFLEDVSYFQPSVNKSFPCLEESESGISSLKRKSSSVLNDSLKKRKADAYDIGENIKQSQMEYVDPNVHEIQNQHEKNITSLKNKTDKFKQREKAHEKQKVVPLVRKRVKRQNAAPPLQSSAPQNDRPTYNNSIQKFTKKSHVPIVSVDELCSRLDSSHGTKGSKQMESSKSTHKSTRLVTSDSNGSGVKETQKHNIKKSKGVADKNAGSRFSTSSIESLIDRKDTKWFDDIVAELSQHTNLLTRKLLATVQKHACDHYAKMGLLRKNIAKAAQILKSDKVFNELELKHHIKNCRDIRKEVEISLQKMHHYGLEYFIAEKECSKMLRKKHIKAGIKYVQSMEEASKNATIKLDKSVLCQTKFFLKKLLKKIRSA